MNNVAEETPSPAHPLSAGGRLGIAGRAVAAGLVVLPLLILVVTVAAWSVDVPFLDQWSLVVDLDNLRHDRFELHQLWRLHNEHRVLFPRLVMLGLACLSGWDVRWEMAVIILLAVSSALMLVHLARRQPLPWPRPVWPWLAVSSLLLFNLNQWQNWCWGWQLTIMLCVAAQTCCLSLLCLQGGRPFGLAAAVLAAVVASYSFLGGMVIWPAALPVLLAAPRRRWTRLAVWLAAAVVVVALFLLGIRMPGNASLALAEPLRAAGYLLAYLGSPLLGHAGEVSMLAGGAGLALFGLLTGWSLLAADRNVRRVAPAWVGLGLVGAGNAVMTSLGRLHFGIDQALASRYVPFANLLWISVLVLGLLWFAGRPATGIRWLRLAGVPAVVLLVACLLAAEVAGGSRLYRACRARQRARTTLLELRSDGPARILHPSQQVLRERGILLWKLRLSCFRHLQGE